MPSILHIYMKISSPFKDQTIMAGSLKDEQEPSSPFVQIDTVLGTVECYVKPQECVEGSQELV